jgi:hypothetical protein
MAPLAASIALAAAAEAAVLTALAAADATSAIAGAAAAGTSSFLPQAVRATAATREASKSDLVICVLKFIRVEQSPEIVGTLTFAEPQRSQAKKSPSLPNT